jgi:hypothetical protein
MANGGIFWDTPSSSALTIAKRVHLTRLSQFVIAATHRRAKRPFEDRIWQDHVGIRRLDLEPLGMKP